MAGLVSHHGSIGTCDSSRHPHHVTQRGNRRQQTFFGKEDYQHYLELISRFCRAEQVAIWAYCLIHNHVHLIVVPQSAESLRRAIGEAHPRPVPGLSIPIIRSMLPAPIRRELLDRAAGDDFVENGLLIARFAKDAAQALDVLADRA